MKKVLLIGAAIAALGVGGALAHGGYHGKGHGYHHGGERHGGYHRRGGGRDRGARLERRFERLDANQDGKVTAEEIDEVRAARFAKMDANGDGGVDAQELVNFRMLQRAERRIERRDQNGDGLLQIDELPKRGARFMRFDLNEDGAVTKAELELAREAMGGRGWGRGRGGRGWDRGGAADDAPETESPE